MHGRTRAAATALSSENAADDDDQHSKGAESVEFVYPRGSTLNVQQPAVALLSSGFVSYPVNRPVAAVCEVKPQRSGQQVKLLNEQGDSRGRVAVLGSWELLSDDFLGKEANGSIADAIFKWLLLARHNKQSEGRNNSTRDAKASLEALLAAVCPEVSAGSSSTRPNMIGGPRGGEDAASEEQSTDHRLASTVVVPDTASLAERLRGCLQESEPLPRDFTRLFDASLFGFSTALVPQTVALFKALGLKHEPLTLIPPQFECPLPSLRPAVFPPTMREPLPPALELFDLDEHFASERARLAQLTNKCGDDDLDYFVREAGHILGVTSRLSGSVAAGEGSTGAGAQTQTQQQQSSAMDVLSHVFRAIANFKKLEQEADDLDVGGVVGGGEGADGIDGELAVPGGVHLRHAVGAAGLGAGVAAGFH